MSKLTLPDIVMKLLLFILAASVLIPILWLLVASFKSEIDISAYPPTFFAKSYTTDAYHRALTEITFVRYYINTVIFAGSVTIVSLTFDSLAGYAFARYQFRGQNILFILILVTLMIPFQVTMIPLYMQEQKMGILNSYAGLILPRATNAFGIFMMRQFFKDLPLELEEAARMDGAGEFKIFYAIMLPLAKPALISLGIFHFMYNWNDLLYPLILTTSNELKTLPAGLALFMGQHVDDYGIIMAGSVMSIIGLLVAYLFSQKYFIQGIASTGIK